MRVVLVYPEVNPWPIPNLGILSVAGVLEAHELEVEIFDCSLEFFSGRIPFDEFVKFVENNPDVDFFGIGFNTRQAFDAYRIANIVRAQRPNVCIVFGGAHPTALPNETMDECPACDVVVLREGEFSMLDIVNGVPLKDIQGIWYRVDSQYRTTGERQLIENLDDLPMTPWHLIDMELYVAPKFYDDLYSPGWRYGTFYTSRGCFGKCHFCFSHGMLGTVGRVHSIERIIKEVNVLVEQYNVQLLNVYDDTLFVTVEHGREVAQAFIDSGLNKRVKWNCQMLAAQVTPELLDLLREAGCFQVAVGFESISPETLKSMRKPASYKRNIETLRYFRNSGMRCLGYFMSGYIGETADEIRANQEFQKYANLEVASWTHYVPFPGTKDFIDLRAGGRIGDSDWPTFNMTQNPVTIKKRNYSAASDEEYIYLYQNHIEEYQFARRYRNSMQRRISRYATDTVIDFPSFDWQPPSISQQRNLKGALADAVALLDDGDNATAHQILQSINPEELSLDNRRLWLEALIFIHLVRVEDRLASEFIIQLIPYVNAESVPTLVARANCSLGNYSNASRILEECLASDRPINSDGLALILYLGMLQGRGELVDAASKAVKAGSKEHLAANRWLGLPDNSIRRGLEKIFERYEPNCPQTIAAHPELFNTAVSPHRYRYLANYLRLKCELEKNGYDSIVLVGFNRWSRHISRLIQDNGDFNLAGIVDDPIARAQATYDGCLLLTIDQARSLNAQYAVVVASDYGMPADLSFLTDDEMSIRVFHLYPNKIVEAALPPSMNRDYFGSAAAKASSDQLQLAARKESFHFGTTSQDACNYR